MHSRGPVGLPWRGALVALLAVAFVASLTLPAAVRAAAAAPKITTGFTVHAEFTPDDPLYASGLEWGPKFIDAPKAWDVTRGTPSVIVAVVDTGVDYYSTDIAPNMWTNTGTNPDGSTGGHGYSFINNNNRPLDADTSEWHGTSVAGVVGAVINNNNAIAGMAQVSIMAVQALGPNGSGSSTNTSLAIRYAADHGARIINLSLGTNETPVGPTDISLAVNYAWSKNALVIAAAGNAGTNGLDYPASLPNVLAVGSVGTTGSRSYFSNFGNGLGMMAPGETIWTLGGDNTTHELSGTSLATPFVTGVAALVLSREPSLTNVELWSILNRTAVPTGSCPSSPCYNTQYGWGIVDAYNAVTALSQPFISVNSYPNSVSRSSSFSVGWSVLGPAGLSVTDTHVVWGTDPNRMGNSTAAQTGTTGQSFTASGLAIPGSANSVSFKVVAQVNGTLYESPVTTVNASSLPDFLFVLINLLSSNLLYLALFILALAAIVAFVPSRRARKARAQYRARAYAQQPAYYTPPPSGPPPAAPHPTVQSYSAPPSMEPAKAAMPQTAAPPPPPPVATKKRCPNCGTIVNADNLFCFFCGQPFR